MIGTSVRLRRIFPPGGRRLFSVPLDHSVSLGPIPGLGAPRVLVRTLVASGVDLVIVPKGVVGRIAPVLGPGTLLGVHLSASTTLDPTPDHKGLVGRAREAVSLGADLASVQVNFGIPGEREMLSQLGETVEEAHALGLPLLAMAYVKTPSGGTLAELQHAARACADLGADIVKTSYPGSVGELRRLVASTPTPVLLGGGERVGGPTEVVRFARAAVAGGAAGISIGRNL
ncbi:MAG TPA: hypothetical protein VGS18_05650, partial [Thermoplasmata archaeon]|nr:hypothetical protein [Thermoplasmata archaeon]